MVRCIRLDMNDIIKACKEMCATDFHPLPEGHRLSADLSLNEENREVSVHVWPTDKPEVK